MASLTVLIALVYGVCLLLVRHRIAPVMFMRVWFTLHLFVSLSMCSAVCNVLNFAAAKKMISRKTKEVWALRVCGSTFGIPLQYGSPHIRVEFMEGSLSLGDVSGQHDLCLCHTSFFDTILYLWLAPYKYVVGTRTFMKSTLSKLPLFGSVTKACGHFPVYFASEESSSFSVDKEKQAAVAAKVDAFLDDKGSLSFFPEGALNRTPEVLKDFRLGSFNTILQRKLPIYYCVTYGNHEVWSAAMDSLPGYPADIFVYIGKFDYDADKEDARSLSTALRMEMQKHLDGMLALREKRKYKPWSPVKSA